MVLTPLGHGGHMRSAGAMDDLFELVSALGSELDGLDAGVWNEADERGS